MSLTILRRRKTAPKTSGLELGTFGHVTFAPGIVNFRELGTFGHVTLAPVTANFRALGSFGVLLGRDLHSEN